MAYIWLDGEESQDKRRCICAGGPQISVDANNNTFWIHEARCGLPPVKAD